MQAPPAPIVSFLAVFLTFNLELSILDRVAARSDWTPVVATALGLAVGAALVTLFLGRAVPRGVSVAIPTGGAVTFALHAHLPDLGFAWGVTVSAVTCGLAAGWAAGALARSRRTSVVLAALTALLLIASGGERLLSRPRLAGTPRGEHPDIVLLVMDTTRRDALGCYGYPRDTTPHLDALAETAAVYDDAWSVSPWTPASHASMFTGLLPAEHGVDGRAQPRFHPSATTLAEVLRDAGYATAGFPANPNLVGEGWERGFDTYRPPWLVGTHSLIASLNRRWIGTGDGWDLDKGTPAVFRLARRWWGSRGDKPRFLFLNLIDPHRPYDPGEPFYGRFLGEVERETARAITQDPVRYHVSPGTTPQDAAILRRLYDAEVASMDAEIGSFVSWLSARDELDGTIFVVTADHGERLGERGLVGHDLVMDTYLLRVPLFVRFPEKVPEGRRRSRVQLTGLPGTVLGLAGVSGPEPMMSRALEVQRGDVAVAQYQDPEWFVARCLERDTAFDAFPFQGDWSLVARDHHAFVQSSRGPGVRGTLIDFVDDPSWSRDLTGDHPEIARELAEVARALPRYVVRGSEMPAQAARERLRSLGYID